MNIRILQTFAVLAFSTFFVVSCIKDHSEIDNISGKPIQVKLSFNLLAEQPTYLGEASPKTYSIADPDNPDAGGTDEGTSENYKPKDVWVIQFNGTADNSTIVGSPHYYSDASTVMLSTTTEINTFVFIANTHDSSLSWSAVSTLADMKNVCKTITGETDCYGNNSSETKDLVMNGVYSGVLSEGTTTLPITLKRNILRIDFILNNDSGSAMTLNSVQLCNVPKSFCWATSLIDGSASYPESDEGGDYMDYPAEILAESGAKNPGGTQTITWYMPLNQKGVSAGSLLDKTKPNFAPNHATYIRIAARNASNELYIYSIYPGANMFNDFNLCANNKYTVELTINASGDMSDGRVKCFNTVQLGEANSFIINPKSGTYFSLPISAERINYFWREAGSIYNYDIYGVYDFTEWTVELLWQDTPESDFIRFVSFTDPESISDPILSTTLEGKGITQHIIVTTKSNYEGNALICLRNKASNKILWSWHLWVTDYNPNSPVEPVDGLYAYSVPNGYVHRYQYDDGTWMKEVYDGKLFMDRNLGARSADYGTIGTLYYQFGRKDPIPMYENGNQLYDINGNARYDIPYSYDDGKVDFGDGAMHPTAFYLSQTDWTSQGRTGTCFWNDLAYDPNVKPLFDPCPYGWRIPRDGAWADFEYNSTTHKSSRGLSWNINGVIGLRYWPLPSNEQPAASIYYPVLGYRQNAYGYQIDNEAALCWTSTSKNVNYAYALRADKTSVTNAQQLYRACGLPVRCIKE